MKYSLTIIRPACAWLLFSSVLLAADRPKEPVDFAHEIVPLLKKHCAECHAGESKKGGFSFNTRADLLEGSENGPVVELGKAAESRLIDVVSSEVEGERMPPEGERLKAAEIEVLKRWIDGGASWEEGFAFQAAAYEPPLRPRRPELPPAHDGRTNPVDRIIDSYLAERKLPRPAPVDDATFARRASLDLTGLLPEIVPERQPVFGVGHVVGQQGIDVPASSPAAASRSAPGCTTRSSTTNRTTSSSAN